MDDIEQSVIDYLRSRAVGKASSASLDGSSRLMETGILDSLELMSLVTHVEQAYGFSLPDEEFVPENFETPRTIADLIRRVKASARSGKSNSSI